MSPVIAFHPCFQNVPALLYMMVDSDHWLYSALAIPPVSWPASHYDGFIIFTDCLCLFSFHHPNNIHILSTSHFTTHNELQMLYRKPEKTFNVQFSSHTYPNRYKKLSISSSGPAQSNRLLSLRVQDLEMSFPFFLYFICLLFLQMFHTT